MKTKFPILLLFVIAFAACQHKTQSLIGKWNINGISPLDTLTNKSAAEVAAISWLNTMASGGTIEFKEDGNYEIKKEPVTMKKGKYMISDNTITLIKPDGTTEKSSFHFESNDELEIKSTTMIMWLKK